MSEALDFLLCVTAWRLNAEIESDGINDEPVSATAKDHVLKMRDQLVTLVSMCFEQFLEPQVAGEFSPEHIEFSAKMQKLACRIAGDLRSLFPMAWKSSESQLLSSLALTDDGLLRGGYVRFLQSQDAEVCDLKYRNLFG